MAAADLNAPSTPVMPFLSRALGRLRRPSPAAPPAGDAATAESDNRAVANLARQLIAEDRYVFVLLREAADTIDPASAAAASKVLAQRMALVPGGVVPVIRGDGSAAVPTEVPAFYLDRCAVTHEQFLRFVRSGSYDDLELWPREVWPSLPRLVDRSGQPGPSGWRGGTFPPGLADHPIVGVCWHEAAAYSRWVGKRLPTVAEWQKAGGWPEQYSGGASRRYPWGDLYADGKANLGPCGPGRTVSAQGYEVGATANGIYQMSGNVWEWLDDPLRTVACRPGQSLVSARPLRRIAGGAFDTYLVNEATNQFATGQPEMDRRPNIGFRCAVAMDKLRPGP